MSTDAFPDYQSLNTNTKGEPGKANRSIPDRIKEYGIDKVVTKESTVLDLGCNRGYFGILLSPYIKSYLGIDISANELQFGIDLKRANGSHNLVYRNESYSVTNYGTFDIIICTAFHIYTSVPMESFALQLVDMLKPKGRLFLEGHPSGYHLPHNELKEPSGYWEPLTIKLDQYLKRITTKRIRDRDNLRPFIHYQK